MHTLLGIQTGGWFHGQAYTLPVERMVVIRGNLADILGRPVSSAEILVRSAIAPSFNLDTLVSTAPVRVYTDASGQMSTSRQNEIAVLRSTAEENSYVRITIPIAGADWIFRMPQNQNVVLLKDLVRNRMVRDLSASPG